MSRASYTSFAMWLEQQHPQLFKVLLKKAQRTAQLRGLYGASSFGGRYLEGLGDYYFSSLTSSLDNASSDAASAFDSSTSSWDGSGIDSTAVSSALDSSGNQMLDEITVTAPADGSGSGFDDAPSDLSVDSGPVTASDIAALTAGAGSATISLPAQSTPTADIPATSLPSSSASAPASAPSSAASAVGNFLTSAQGIQTLIGAAATVIGATAAANAIAAQAARARANQAAANVSYSTNGTPILTTTSGQQIPLTTAASIAALSPSSLSGNMLWVLFGLGAVLLATQ